MTEPSIKKVSAADIEGAIAQSLKQLTGWETCTVNLRQVQFENAPMGPQETLTMTLRVALGPKDDGDGLPF